MHHENETTLVIGGTGKTGRRVAERLTARGRAVRVVSRSSPVPFDWNDERTWAGALSGVRSMYVTYFPDLALPDAAEHLRRLSKRAVGGGVEKIVVLAGRGEPGCQTALRAVRESGAAVTALECAFFSQNFSEGVLSPLNDEIAFPAGAVVEPFIDCDDIADVAVAALTDDAHAGQSYELTGPELLTFAEATGLVAEASRRNVRYVQVSYEAFGEMLATVMPRDQGTFFTELLRFLFDGHNAHVTDGVERVLGRKPRDFRAFARDAAPNWQT